MARSAPTRVPKGLVGGEARLDTNPLAPDNGHRNEPRQSGRCWSWAENARTPQALSWSVCCPAPLGPGTGPGSRGPETPPRAEAWVAVVHFYVDLSRSACKKIRTPPYRVVDSDQFAPASGAPYSLGTVTKLSNQSGKASLSAPRAAVASPARHARPAPGRADCGSC